MSNPSDSINGIAAWLASQFPGATANAHADSHRDVILFRVRSAAGTVAAELEISEEALHSFEPEAIISDLLRQDVPQRLKQDPTLRLAYTTQREVPHLESLAVLCDGRHYRIVRDSTHSIRVFDQADRLLQHMPPTLLVLPTSIFRKPAQLWCEEIRAWRGADQ